VEQNDLCFPYQPRRNSWELMSNVSKGTGVKDNSFVNTFVQRVRSCDLRPIKCVNHQTYPLITLIKPLYKHFWYETLLNYRTLNSIVSVWVFIRLNTVEAIDSRSSIKSITCQIKLNKHNRCKILNDVWTSDPRKSTYFDNSSPIWSYARYDKDPWGRSFSIRTLLAVNSSRYSHFDYWPILFW
jgi:hypothetical protein